MIFPKKIQREICYVMIYQVLTKILDWLDTAFHSKLKILNLWIFSDTIVGSYWGPVVSFTLGHEQSHKRVRHHILTQNLKSLSLLVISLL